MDKNIKLKEYLDEQSKEHSTFLKNQSLEEARKKIKLAFQMLQTAYKNSKIKSGDV